MTHRAALRVIERSMTTQEDIDPLSHQKGTPRTQEVCRLLERFTDKRVHLAFSMTDPQNGPLLQGDNLSIFKNRVYPLSVDFRTCDG